MSQASLTIPVDHICAIHEIPMESDDEPRPVTLLELIQAVSEFSHSEQEVVATVSFMLNSGRVRLTGNFRDTPIENLCDYSLPGSMASSG